MTRRKSYQQMRVLDRELHDELADRLARDDLHERRAAGDPATSIITVDGTVVCPICGHPLPHSLAICRRCLGQRSGP